MDHWPRMNMTSGPVDLTARTAAAHGRPVLSHYDPMFLDLFARCTSLLQQTFQTEHDVLIMQGEAMLGLEAAAASLLSPGDTVLNLVSGPYGKGYESFLRLHGAKVVEVAVPYDDVVDPDTVRLAIRRHPEAKFLSVVHVETPSGTVNPLQEICTAAHSRGLITIADVVSSLGAEPLRIQEWGIDVAVAGSQKAIGGAPGLALLAVSPEAWATMENKSTPLRGSYLSLLDWRDTWLENRRFPHAPTVHAVYALESALTQVLEYGLERWIERHRQIGAACRAGVKALGFTLWPARAAVAASSVTTVRLPDGLTDTQIRALMRDRYDVAISASEGALAGKVLRLGHMATAAHPTYLAAQLAIFERVLADLGRPVHFGAGVGAAMAALDGWS